MGLFSKECVICGGSAGALSGEKISEGRICGDCADKLNEKLGKENKAVTRDEIADGLQGESLGDGMVHIAKDEIYLGITMQSYRIDFPFIE